MSRQRPLATALATTALVAALAVVTTGGHSPFRLAASAAESVAAAADATATAGPTDDATALVDPAQTESAAPTDGAASPTADPTATQGGADPTTSGGGPKRTPAPTPAPRPGATPAPTHNPTPDPTPDPTVEPTPNPTPAPTPRPTPAPAAASLSITVSGGQPHLSWTACTAGNFAAYAVVRSTDSEIHFPAETNDTLVALVKSAASTSLIDAGAPAGVRAYYRVWCTYLADTEYKTIWTTPVVSVTP